MLKKKKTIALITPNYHYYKFENYLSFAQGEREDSYLQGLPENSQLNTVQFYERKIMKDSTDHFYIPMSFFK